MNRAYETVACQCGEPTIAARGVCSLCEADEGLFAPAPAKASPTCPDFERWWETPNERTGHPPSATLDRYSARTAWDAALRAAAGN